MPDQDDEQGPAVLYLRRVAEMISKIPPEVQGRDRQILEQCFDSLAGTINRAERIIFMKEWGKDLQGENNG